MTMRESVLPKRTAETGGILLREGGQAWGEDLPQAVVHSCQKGMFSPAMARLKNRDLGG